MSLNICSIWNDDHMQSTRHHSSRHSIVEPDRETKDAPALRIVYKLYPRPSSPIFLRSGIRAWGRGYKAGCTLALVGLRTTPCTVQSMAWPVSNSLLSPGYKYVIESSLVTLVLLFAVWTQIPSSCIELLAYSVLSQCFMSHCPNVRCLFSNKFSTVVWEIDMVYAVRSCESA